MVEAASDKHRSSKFFSLNLHSRAVGLPKVAQSRSRTVYDNDIQEWFHYVVQKILGKKVDLSLIVTVDHGNLLLAL